MDSTNKSYFKLNDILFNISITDHKDLTDSKKEELLLQLEEFYEVHDRHQYSDILNFIYKSNPENSEYFMYNLIEIYEYSEDPNLKEKIFEIIDHVRLENLRSTQITSEIKAESKKILSSLMKDNNTRFGKIKRDIDKQIGITNINIDDMKGKIDETKDEIEKYEDKIKKLNIESITILSIFSGIVMAFFGGMSFFNEVLKNMHTVSKYRITFISLTIGLVLFNTIFLFLYYVGKLVDKPIREECLYEKCSECDEKCKLGKKVKNLYPILFYVDLLILMSLSITFIFWTLNKLNILNL